MSARTPFRGLSMACLAAAALVGCVSEAAKSGTKPATECAQSDLIAQCPPNTRPSLDVDAEAICSSSGSVDLSQDSMSQSGSAAVENACVGRGSCRLVCELLAPCEFGVKSVSAADGILCREPTGCGNGVCDPGESFEDCPIDCGGEECTPDERRCVGEALETCTPRGVWGEGIACPSDLLCRSVAGTPAGCVSQQCGDGTRDEGELCDDANTVEGDGCDNNCTPSGCGNGRVTEGEACDDGNDVGDDRCSNECTLARCGDGILQAGEQCDDANDDDADRCTAGCRLPMCGDGITQPGEQCDDGNDVDTDACTPACRLPRCGDGIVQDGEACDDADDDDLDGCTTACARTSCGDGQVQDGEACDDGNGDDTDACLSSCVAASCGDGFLHAGVEPCDDGNDGDDDACTTGCQLAFCGDGHVQTDVEACDDGNDDDTDDCTTACALPRCGDGTIQGTETCDDGNEDDTDACTARCVPATCGDGLVHAGVEACDDANDVEYGPNDACDNSCRLTESEPNDNGRAADVLGPDGRILGVLAPATSDYFRAPLLCPAGMECRDGDANTYTVRLWYERDALLGCATLAVSGVACADLTFCGARGEPQCRERIPAGKRLVLWTTSGAVGGSYIFGLTSSAELAFTYEVEVVP